jgi:hypothetical protein
LLYHGNVRCLVTDIATNQIEVLQKGLLGDFAASSFHFSVVGELEVASKPMRRWIERAHFWVFLDKLLTQSKHYQYNID